MSTLNKLIEEYTEYVPDHNVHAYVGGISALGAYLADFPEGEWGERLDSLMAEVGGYAEVERAKFQKGEG